LPREWVDDPARRATAGVPASVAFATKPTLAQQMLERAFAAGVPAVRVTSDEISGDDPDLRRWLEAERHRCVLAVSSNHALWHDGVLQRIDALVTALPVVAWASVSAGEGSQGERLHEWACLRLPFPTADGHAQ
jgi:SRSO17 transposase